MFSKYDYVQIGEVTDTELQGDIDAVVTDVIHEKIEGEKIYQYGVYIKDIGHVAFYQESDLTLIEKNRKDILNTWINGAVVQPVVDLDYIFAEGDKLRYTREVINKIAESMKIDNQFYALDSFKIMDVIRPYIQTNDKAGWLEYCEGLNG